tara:strand:- start:2542 stop:2832 length:291 start_codon:yes stop_codon:yes gene_type:complete
MSIAGELLGEVVSIVTVSGEYIGILDTESLSGGEVIIENPRMLIATDEGVGFAKGVCMTGMADVKMVRFKDYVFLTRTNAEFAKAYKEATTLIQLV